MVINSMIFYVEFILIVSFIWNRQGLTKIYSIVYTNLKDVKL